jgi:hypothetical protein
MQLETNRMVSVAQDIQREVLFHCRNTASESMLRKLKFQHVTDVKWVRFTRKPQA